MQRLFKALSSWKSPLTIRSAVLWTACTFFIDCPNTPLAFSLPRGRLRGGRVRRAALTIWSFILVNVPFSHLLPLETIILPSNKLNLKAVSEILWCALQPVHTFLWPGACFPDLCTRCRHIRFVSRNYYNCKNDVCQQTMSPLDHIYIFIF